VDAEEVRSIAEADVLGVPGVASAIDDIAVAPSDPGDLRRAVEARRVIGDDPWLDAEWVQVTVSRGIVHLTGWVASAAQRARAERDARSTTPSGVDLDGLRIDAWTDDGTLRDRAPSSLSDLQIAKNLTDAFVGDPRVHPFVPALDVRNGIVVLTGVAPNGAAAAAAADDAGDVPGVREVHDDLKLRNNMEAARSDAATLMDVRDAITGDPRLGSEPIGVDVVGGRVYLKGWVSSDEDRVRAVAVATGVPGTRDVDDGLHVETPRLHQP
jgi:osmotically-inducible protein OsmY